LSLPAPIPDPIIYHLPKEKVTRTDIPVDFAIKTIISCGAGSESIFNTLKKIDGTKIQLVKSPSPHQIFIQPNKTATYVNFSIFI
jgi:uncharacterized membrane protein